MLGDICLNGSKNTAFVIMNWHDWWPFNLNVALWPTMTSRISEHELNAAHTGHTMRSDEALEQYGIRRRMRLSSAQVKGQSLVIFVEQHFTATINRKQLILEGSRRDDLHPRCTWPAHLPVPLRSPVNILRVEPRLRCRTTHTHYTSVYRSINNKFVGVAVCVTFALGIYLENVTIIILQF